MKTYKENFILATDFYKHTHWLQDPKGTTAKFTYIESRGGRFDKTRFFGLQAFLIQYLEGIVVEQWMIDDADSFLYEVFGHKYFNKEGWQKIVDVYGGHLPIAIYAVKEGTVVDGRNIIVAMETLDPELSWLGQFLETMLLRAVWYPTSVCTLSYYIRELVKKYADLTGSPINPFALNDFGARGVSSKESAGLGGMAHLVNFLGTDTGEGLVYARRFYGKANGYSVFATEHGTTTIWGKERELEAYTHFLNTAPDNAIVSIVIDSYNTEYATRNYIGTALKEKILSRAGKVVIRPDSGDPVEQAVMVANILWECFGGTWNANSYRVINPKVGIIYGDGINIDSMEEILIALMKAGFASENIVFGSGGALLQAHTRDDLKFAAKCCAAEIDNKWVDVYKDPVTDTGKKSKRGRLKLIKKDGEYKTVRIEEEGENLLQLVFKLGKLYNVQTFGEVRNAA